MEEGKNVLSFIPKLVFSPLFCDFVTRLFLFGGFFGLLPKFIKLLICEVIQLYVLLFAYLSICMNRFLNLLLAFRVEPILEGMKMAPQ